jgi:MFS family permease
MATAEHEVRGLARYGALFANRHAVALLAWGITARLPLGMGALALVLLVRGAGGSYRDAGIVTAMFGAGVALGAPYGGRQVDRRGARPVLRVRMVLCSAFFALVALLGGLSAPIPAVAVAAAAAGLTMAPIAPALRSIWPIVAGEDGANTAYALDAALQEMIWVGGPLIVTVLAAFDPVAAVAGVAVIAFVGTFAFARIPPIAASSPSAERHTSRLGALSAVGVRTIMLTAVCLGFGFGSLEIAVPAFADLHGNRALAGIGLAGFAAGSLVGGLLAGLRPIPDERRRIIFGTFVLSLAVALPLAATSMPTMTILLFFAGLPIAPVVAAVYGLLGRVAAPGTVAEAFSWFGTAIGVGIAVGNLAGGWLIDERGWRASAVLATAGVGGACVATFLRRSTLEVAARA